MNHVTSKLLPNLMLLLQLLLRNIGLCLRPKVSDTAPSPPISSPLRWYGTKPMKDPSMGPGTWHSTRDRFSWFQSSWLGSARMLVKEPIPEYSACSFGMWSRFVGGSWLGRLPPSDGGFPSALGAFGFGSVNPLVSSVCISSTMGFHTRTRALMNQFETWFRVRPV